jgi:hypothetical protein
MVIIIKDTPSVWRGIAGLSLGVWLLVMGFNVFCLDPAMTPQHEQNIITLPVFMAISLGTLFGFTALLVFPTWFYIYAGIFCSWGLLSLIDGGGVAGLIMYLLGMSFAWRQGFFKRGRAVKIPLLILAAIAAICLQYRYGVMVFINTIVSCFGLFLMIGIGVMALLPVIQKRRETLAPYPTGEEAGTAAPSALDVSEQDRDILSRIQKGEKYERIARELGVSASTVKRRVKELFQALRTPNLVDFLRRYKEEPVDAVIESVSGNRPGVFHNVGAPSGIAAMIKERLQGQGVSDPRIASIDQKIADVIAECDKETVNTGIVQNVLSKIEEKAGPVARELVSHEITQALVKKIGG